MRITIVLTLIIYLFIGIPGSAFACSPPPWSYEILSKDTKAILYGKVVSIRNNGRAATLAVTSYVGPGEAPKKVFLPSTVDSRVDENDKCGDLSTKFSGNKYYIVFLADTPPDLRLAHPQWMTALSVSEKKLVKIDMKQTWENVDSIMQKYSKSRGIPVKYPSENSPTWCSKNMSILIIGFVFIIVPGLYIVYILKFRNRK